MFKTSKIQESEFEDLSKNFGKILREARQSKGLTIQELSSMVGISYSAVVKYETDDKRIPDLLIANRLFEALGYKLCLVSEVEGETECAIVSKFRSMMEDSSRYAPMNQTQD